MALQQLVSPTFIVNNISYTHVVNSIEIDPGLGEQKMRAVSSGGGSVETVYANDLSGRLTSVKASLVLTDEVKDIIEVWKENLNQNSISITDQGVSFHVSHVALLNKINYKFSVDGNVELEFGGDQAS